MLLINPNPVLTSPSSIGNPLLSVASFIQAEGTLSLAAGSGIVFLSSLFGANTAKTLVINSDYESAGDGTLTLVTSKVLISNNSDIIITAWDVDLSGAHICWINYMLD